MANVLNPETECITLNTELETPTLDPATELEQQPSFESTSNLSTSSIANAEVVDAHSLDADAPTEPVAEAATPEEPSATETPAAPASVAAPVAPAPAAATRAPAHSNEPADDFSE